ncbi:MAG: MBL fold metallo-hydrolase RNA specificity domain-containing protein, partial [Gammaproteobacteria bacterium]
YLVHGEEEAMSHFAKLLTGTEVRMPELGDEFSL